MWAEARGAEAALRWKLRASEEVAVEGLFGFDEGVRKWYLWVLISCQTRGGRQTVGEKTLPSSRKGEGTESAPITAQLKDCENAHGGREGPLDP